MVKEMKMQPKRRDRAALLLASSIAVGGICAAAAAQTNGTWGVDVGTAGGSWSVASNWVGFNIAGSGGAATFTTLPFSTAPLSIIQDQANVTLSGISFDSFITYLLKPSVITNTVT